MLKAIIIDDESRARSALKQEITLNCPDVHIIGEADSISASVSLLEKADPDIIFLDIQLSDGLGFTVLEQIENDDYAIIFTTAYSEYALKAFKTSAVDYLLKPIDSEELVAAVNKVKNAKEEKHLQQVANSARRDLNALQQKKIILHTTEGLHVIPVGDIIRCNSYGNYSFVFLKDGSKILLAKILKEIEESLQHYGFERVHHSHLINLNHVKSFRNKDGGMVMMSDMSEVPVSMRKKSAFLDELEKLNSL
ncbi:MAG TPA: LytTR family DNA-binding domain-containing protein [Chitinophagales bacterium]|nr:LytTR family DNA-binding domain-containing protein [Chitinophagales bacterium]HNF68354.1 LytTR family DNA-binding domain-containing protein [Chitinophagales bacterium]HNJ88122.1 LytTR family DNA-binding domain-containing protein [Chitinophagales bacterium]